MFCFFNALELCYFDSRVILKGLSNVSSISSIGFKGLGLSSALSVLIVADMTMILKKYRKSYSNYIFPLDKCKKNNIKYVQNSYGLFGLE